MSNILVYQMGKTAGSTVARSLAQYGLEGHHIHNLRWDVIQNYFDRIGSNPPVEHWQVSKDVRTYMDQRWGDVRWKIVGCFREPISRFISVMFEEFNTFFKHLAGRTDDAAVREILDVLLGKLKDYHVTNDFVVNRTLNWFDYEMKEVFGFDVYGHPFDHERGWSVYSCEHADILLMKFERFREIGARAVQEFLDLPQFRLVNANVGMEKPSKHLYKKVQETIAVPQDVLDRIYGTKYVKHFYTDEEVQNFREKWGGAKELLAKGRAWADRGKTAQAAECFGKALERDQSRETILSVSRFLEQSGRPMEAHRLLRAYLEERPADREIIALERALSTGEVITK